MTKAAFSEDRLRGQKCYSRSRNLFEAKETRVMLDSPEGQQLLRAFKAMEPIETFSSEHLSEHYGLITYTQYQIKHDTKGVIQNGKECASIS